MIYLAGPITGFTEEYSRGWREMCKVLLEPETLDPTRRNYGGRESEPEVAMEIVLEDKADIDASDAILVFYEYPSVGTSMEMLYAFQKGKYVVVVDKSCKPLSPWIVYHSDAIFNTFVEATAHLNDICLSSSNRQRREA